MMNNRAKSEAVYRSVLDDLSKLDETQQVSVVLHWMKYVIGNLATEDGQISFSAFVNYCGRFAQLIDGFPAQMAHHFAPTHNSECLCLVCIMKDARKETIQ